MAFNINAALEPSSGLHPAVMIVPSASSMAAALLLPLLGRHSRLAERSVYLRLLHQGAYLIDFSIIDSAVRHPAQRIIVPAHDFLLRCIAADLLVAHAVAYHIDTHVGRRLVRILAVDALENGIEHRKNLDVAIIIDRHLAIGLEMVRVNHVHIIEISRRSLIRQVQRMLERQIPDRERLELRIAGLDTPFVLLIELGQTHSHLSAARSRSRNRHERPGGRNVVIPSETVLRVDQGHIVRIALDGVVVIGLDTAPLQLDAVVVRAGLTIVVSDDHGADQEAMPLELIMKPQHIHVIRDAQVIADLVPLNVQCAYDNDDFRAVGQLPEHAHLGIRPETRQNPACMIVIEKFTSEFEVKFVSELRNPLSDVFGLNF